MTLVGTHSDYKTLDVGCGSRKQSGAIGIDINARSQADLVHDLNVEPYPFEEIFVNNVLEHLNDVIKTFEDLRLIGKSGTPVKIIVPYFQARLAYIAHTHRHLFGVVCYLILTLIIRIVCCLITAPLVSKWRRNKR